MSRTRPAVLAGPLLATVLLFPLAGCDRGGPTDGAGAPNGGAAAAAAAAPQDSAIHLTELTGETGLDMVAVSGALPSTWILEVNGSGVGFIDYDDDGDLDVFAACGATMDDPEHGPGSRLFRNDGGLRFHDVTAEAGIDLVRWAMGVAVGDVDGDGHDDIYVTCFGPNVLLRNRGDGTFEERAAAAGVDDPGWGTSAGFGDLDGDGDLDLYVVNYLDFDVDDPPKPVKYKDVQVMAGPHGLVAEHDVAYENLGDGTFRDATDAWGMRPERAAYGLNVVIVDVDGDDDRDVYVGNDSMPNLLYINDGAGHFEDRGLASGAAGNIDGAMQATMGLAIADVDGNGRPDIFSTNFSSDTNTLHLNADGRFFDDRTQSYGLGMISRSYLGWACAFLDLDHDGDEDLLMFNGHVYPEASPETMDSPYEQTPLLFARRGGRFERIEPGPANPWLAETHRDRAAAFGDLDRDGDVDAVVSELNGPLRLLRNDRDGGTWLVVALRDTRDGSMNPRGIGSVITLRAGDAVQRRWLVGGGGFQSASPPEAHFALPAPAEAVLEVRWPDGTTMERAVERWGERIVVERR